MRQWTVDAFASEPFRGNPACVVEPFDVWPSDRWMQALAQENNLSETAYLVRTAEPERFGLRWFTPGIEAPFCGHATLAAAHVLFAELGATAQEIVFETRFRGEVRVAREGSGYRLDFPSDPPRRIAVPAGLAEALGAEPVEVWAGQYLVAVMADEAAVRGLAPDLARLKALGVEAYDGPGNVAAAAVADVGMGYDVVSRFFAPGSAIAEDPTTGSAHTILAPVFAEKLGRPRMRCHQAFPGRGGDLVCELAGDRVIITGDAVTVLESRLRLTPQ